MAKVIIQEFTNKFPVSMIGGEAGICWGSNTADAERNYKRGVECLANNHGRTFEFVDVYMILDGYSARVIREWYTHIGGAPTRLQESTRYVSYKAGFNYVTPPTINNSKEALAIYEKAMNQITEAVNELDALGIPKEDSSMLLPLGMETKIVCKHNLRNLIDMSHQRMCSRAYHEYRKLFGDVTNALRNYSDEWKYIVDNYFKPKCEELGYCPERYSCGRKPKP